MRKTELTLKKCVRNKSVTIVSPFLSLSVLFAGLLFLKRTNFWAFPFSSPQIYLFKIEMALPYMRRCSAPFRIKETQKLL